MEISCKTPVAYFRNGSFICTSINNSHPPYVIRCALGALEPLHQRSAHVPCGARRPSAQRGIHPPVGLVRRQPEGSQRVRRPGGHRHPRRREENR